VTLGADICVFDDMVAALWATTNNRRRKSFDIFVRWVFIAIIIC
jgi:hypothetical protein